MKAKTLYSVILMLIFLFVSGCSHSEDTNVAENAEVADTKQQIWCNIHEQTLSNPDAMLAKRTISCIYYDFGKY